MNIKKLLSCAAALLVAVPSGGLRSLAAETGEILVGSMDGICGQTVDVPVFLNTNPGITALSLDLSYDPASLRLLGAADGGILGTSTFLAGGDLSAVPYRMNWDDLSETDNTGTGVLAVLTFEITAEAPGECEITLSVNQESTFNVAFEDVAFDVLYGGITVVQQTTTTAVTTTTTPEPTTTTTTVTTTTSPEPTTTTATVTTTTSPEPTTTTTTVTTTTSPEPTTTTTTVTTTTSPEPTTTTTTVMTTTSETETTAPVTGIISVDTVQADTGDTIEVPIRIGVNPGLTALSLQITYDSEKLTLIDVTDGKLLGSSVFLSGKDLTQIPYTLNWDDIATEDNTGTGIAAVLTFEVSAQAYGTAEIGITVNERSTFNVNMDAVTFATENGAVVIGGGWTPLIGDVNTDGSVTLADAVELMKYLAASREAKFTLAGLAAADLDGNGMITTRDARLLLQMLEAEA